MKFKYNILAASFVVSLLLWVSLNLNLSYEIERTVPVRINVNKPFAVANELPLTLDAKVKGSGWTLLRLFTSYKLNFNYDVYVTKNEQIMILTKQYLNDNALSGQNLTATSVKPESLFVYIGRYEEKYVKVIPRVYVDCKDGYQTVGLPMIEPDSIKVGGASQILDSLKYVYTQDLIYKNASSVINDMVGLSDSLSNVIWKSTDKVSLTVNVELKADKEFRNVDIKVTNVPQDKDVLLIPQIITVNVKGGVNQLAGLDNSKIFAEVDYSELLRDTTGAVYPKFILPAGVTVFYAKPDKIQYVIKKKFE
jgi:YbbR domain-containing protein